MSSISAVRVKDIILDNNHPFASQYGGPDAIGFITFKGMAGGSSKMWSDKINVAKPLFSNIKNHPLLNEIVLIIDSIDDSIYNKGGSSKYYLPSIAIFNHPHHNALPPLSTFKNNNPTTDDYIRSENGMVRRVIDEGTDIVLGEYFKEQMNIKPLTSYEGDVIIEGRFGNSIRFGSTNIGNIFTRNNWSSTGSIGDPITIIRNGQQEFDNPDMERAGWINQPENIDNDASSIYLTSNQQIMGFTPSSIHKSSYGAEQSHTPWETKLLNPEKSNNIRQVNIPSTTDFLNVQEDPILHSPINETSLNEEPSSEYKDSNLRSSIIEIKTDNQTIDFTDTIILNEETKISPTTNPSGSSETNGGLNQKIGKYYTFKQLIYSERFTSNTNLSELVNINNKQASAVIKVKSAKNEVEENISGIITVEWSRDNVSLKNSDGREYTVNAELGGFPGGHIFRNLDEIKGMKSLQNNEPYTLEALSQKAIDSIANQGTEYLKNNPEILSKLKSFKSTPIQEVDLKGRLTIKGGIVNNYPGVDTIPTSEEIFKNLKNIMTKCIDPLKDQFPDLTIISAYRSKELNKQIGGASASSEHIRGHAVDIKSNNTPTSVIFNWCIKNLPEWNNLLWAYPERDDESWIHISYIEGGNQKHRTLASEREDFHEFYGGIRRGNKKEYQDNIPKANNTLI